MYENCTILLTHGYIGFGKTTIAKKFEELGYKRFTHDEYMSKLFGDHPTNEDFVANYNKATEIILKEAFVEVKQKHNIILDFGFWSRKDRKEICNILNSWNLDFKPSMIWINVECDISVARQRCINRDKNRKPGELWVPVEVFDMKLDQFEPMDNYPEEFNFRLNFRTDV